MIPYGRQEIVDIDIEHVVSTLRSDFLTQGPVVPAFERALCDYTGASFCTTFNSATSALHASCLALGLGPGDICWTSPITFVASANCALMCGASVDFVDIDKTTLNISICELEAKLESAQQTNSLPKLLVPVHMSGHPCDMVEISRLSKRFGFRIIEDASHAIGAEYFGNKVGQSEFSDITVFSFHPVKIITTGEGGAALTNDAALADRLRLLCTHGITRDPKFFRNRSHGPWYYEQHLLGFNYRMTDMQAALGLSQLNRLDSYVSSRNALAERYKVAVAEFPLDWAKVIVNSKSSYHLFVVRLLQDKHIAQRRFIFDKLREAGIGVNVHYIPVHLQPFFSDLGFKPGDFPESESYYQQALTLPLYPGLGSAKFDYIVNELAQIFQDHLTC